MKELHPSTPALVDSMVQDICAMINAAAEAGDLENATALFAEWDEWISGDLDTPIEVTCLPLLSAQ